MIIDVLLRRKTHQSQNQTTGMVYVSKHSQTNTAVKQHSTINNINNNTRIGVAGDGPSVPASDHRIMSHADALKAGDNGRNVEQKPTPPTKKKATKGSSYRGRHLWSTVTFIIILGYHLLGLGLT